MKKYYAIFAGSLESQLSHLFVGPTGFVGTVGLSDRTVGPNYWTVGPSDASCSVILYPNIYLQYYQWYIKEKSLI